MKTLKLVSMVVLVTVISFANSFAQVYKIDAAKSTMKWLGKKVTGEHTGTISVASGEFTVDKDKISKGKFEIDMTTIKNTDVTSPEYAAKLDGHLKSEDFFGVEKFPKATFVIDQECKIVKGNSLVKGKITIKGVTQPIEFKAVLFPSTEGFRIYANIILDRTKFGVKYGSGSFFDDLGDKTIYDEFTVTLNILATK